MAEIDPLKILGMVNQFQKAPAPNKALQDLQTKGAITGMQQRGAMDRALQSGIDTRRNTGLGLGINVGPSGNLDPTALSDLRNFKRAKDLETLSKSFSDFRRGGGSFNFPKGGILPSQLPDQRLILGEFPGVAAEKIKSTFEKGKKVSGQQLPGGGPQFGTEKYEDTEKAKQQNTPKAKDINKSVEAVMLAPKRQKDLVNSIQRQNPNSVIENPRIINGVIYIDIDTVPTAVRVKAR